MPDSTYVCLWMFIDIGVFDVRFWVCLKCITHEPSLSPSGRLCMERSSIAEQSHASISAQMTKKRGCKCIHVMIVWVCHTRKKQTKKPHRCIHFLQQRENEGTNDFYFQLPMPTMTHFLQNILELRLLKCSHLLNSPRTHEGWVPLVSRQHHSYRAQNSVALHEASCSFCQARVTPAHTPMTATVALQSSPASLLLIPLPILGVSAPNYTASSWLLGLNNVSKQSALFAAHMLCILLHFHAQ